MAVEKISKEIFVMNKLKVLHQVSFGQKNKDGTRRDSIYHYSYPNVKYTDVGELTAYTVDSFDSLIFQYNDWSAGAADNRIDKSVMLSYAHIPKLKRALREVMNWFYEDDDVFVLDDSDEVVVNDAKANLEVTAYGLIQRKSITFKPYVVDTDDERYEGVIMFVGSRENMVTLTIDQIDALTDFIENFRLYEASVQLMAVQQLITPLVAKDKSEQYVAAKPGPTTRRRN